MKNSNTFRIEQINQHNYSDYGKINGNSIVVKSKLIFEYKEEKFSCSVSPVEKPFTKRYLEETIDFDEFDQKSQTVFFVYQNAEVTGRIMIKKHWNNYGFIDIAVDQAYRRRGIGKNLIKTALRWAKDHQFPGLIAETQNINVPACTLYEKCGFELCGFDSSLYRGLNPPLDEIALFWYYKF